MKVHIEQEAFFYDSSSIFPYNAIAILLYIIIPEYYGNRPSRAGDSNRFFF